MAQEVKQITKKEALKRVMEVLAVDYGKSFGCCVCENGDVFIATEGAVPIEVDLLMTECPEVELMYVGDEPTIIIREAM